MLDAIKEAVLESLIGLPILFVIYFLMELLEHKNEVKFEKFVARSKKTGPLWGSIIGCVPQCAFSAVMADLFSRKMITIGTLLAVFIATSDEAVVLLASKPDKILSVLALIAFKVVIAVIVGFVADFLIKNQKLNNDDLHHSKHYNHEHSHSHENHEHKYDENKEHIHSDCNDCEHCETCIQEKKSCEDCSHNALHHSHEIEVVDKKLEISHILLEALKHTLIIFAWVLAINLILTVVTELVGMEGMQTVFLSGTIFEPIILTLFGLIPNCAASVAIVDLYINGVVTFGSCVGALCTGAGIGLVILFKNNKNLKQNLFIMLSLYLIGVLVGFIINLIPIGL